MNTNDPRQNSTAKSQRGYGQAIGDALGAVVGGTLNRAVASVGGMGRVLGNGLRLSGLRSSHPGKGHHHSEPGAAPGIEHAPEVDTPPPPQTVHIRCVDYGPDSHWASQIAAEDLSALLDQPETEQPTVRWINIDGLHPYVINQVRQAQGYHTLAAEDVLHAPQRPKLERHEDHLFIVARMPRVSEGRLSADQVSVFLSQGLIISFQETRGDVFDPIRRRLSDPNSVLRHSGADYLTYALLDAMVDHCFPILEGFGDLLEELEEQVMDDAQPTLLRRIHGVKRELSLLRRVIWPMREVVSALQGQDLTLIEPSVRPYLRDVYDHTVQIVDIVETFRDMVAGLTDLYMSAQGNRMNEIMKVLTIMSTLFIPITFVAGVYGMNFEHIPELKWHEAYPAFWGLCGVITLGLLGFFWWRGWIGRR